MDEQPHKLKKVRFYVSLSTLYLLTIWFGWYAVNPAMALGKSADQVVARRQVPHLPPAPRIKLIYGKPVRIVIPASGVDLPVDDGYYDPATKEWTLSGYRAQFAMASTLANNTGGNTFIYGHNNNYVFGALRHVTPTVGAQALLYTDNGHIFSYKFESVVSLTPDDVSSLRYQGPPIMTIQTCTGSVNEWRTLFRYNFDKVIQ